MPMRCTVYVKHEKAIEKLQQVKNKSAYIEKAVLFYIDNKDAIKEYADHMTALTKILSDKI